MTDDTSAIISNASCYTIISSNNIYAYRSNIRYSYSQIGGKWFQTGQSTSTTVPSTAYCVPYSTITSLSSYSYMYPVYLFMAFILAVFVWFFAYRIFWRNIIRWRL